VSDNCSVTSTTCVPASASTFAVGDSTVACTAADAASNQSSCGFNVHVKGAAEQASDLIAAVNNLATKSGTKNALLAKLTTALEKLQSNNTAAACGRLQSFINDVNAQRGKDITASDADALIAAATQIRAVDGCAP
jgi:predicted negative regulator of RcsB-dependent stress response